LKTFSFRLPTEIEFGNGVSALVAERARELAASRVLVVTDPGVRAAGLVEAPPADSTRRAWRRRQGHPASSV